MEPYQQLEQEWAKFNDLDPTGMVACSSGTAALHLALEAMRLPQGSEVITGDFNMVAVPRAIAIAGLTPVFVDCQDNLNIDMRLVQEEVARRSTETLPGPFGLTDEPVDPHAAIIVTAIYGRRAIPDCWTVFNDLKVIEDLAEAHGVRPHGLTDAACWSFYKNKIIAGEEGGAVWFRDPAHAALARQLRSLGFTDAHDYTHVPHGHNYRMSNLHAGPILKSIASCAGCWHCGGKGYHDPMGTDSRGDPVGGGRCGICSGRGTTGGNAVERRQIESWYDEFCPPEWRMPARDAVWVYDLRIQEMSQETQDKVVASLKEAGIAARHGFKPMHRQEEFEACRLVMHGGTSNASFAADEVIYLPVQPGRTTRDDCRRAFETIKATLPPAS